MRFEFLLPIILVGFLAQGLDVEHISRIRDGDDVIVFAEFGDVAVDRGLEVAPVRRGNCDELLPGRQRNRDRVETGN